MSAGPSKRRYGPRTRGLVHALDAIAPTEGAAIAHFLARGRGDLGTSRIAIADPAVEELLGRLWYGDLLRELLEADDEAQQLALCRQRLAIRQRLALDLARHARAKLRVLVPDRETRLAVHAHWHVRAAMAAWSSAPERLPRAVVRVLVMLREETARARRAAAFAARAEQVPD